MREAKRNFTDSFWILKCDIRKYFFNIDHDILYSLIERKIKDKKVLDLIKTIIYSVDDEVGVPIGNYTSQYFANIYLAEMDKYIKYELKVKYVCRYMDDFVLLLETKEQAKNILKKLEIFLKEKLKLELNSKTNYFPESYGANFCGYRIWATHMLLRNQSKKRMKRKMKKFQKMYKNGEIKIKDITPSVMSWWGHVIHCNSYRLICKIFNKYGFSKE